MRQGLAPGSQHQGQRLIREAAGERRVPLGKLPWAPRGEGQGWPARSAHLLSLCPGQPRLSTRPAVPPLRVAFVPVPSLYSKCGRDTRGCRVGSWPGGTQVPEESRQLGLHSPATPRLLRLGPRGRGEPVVSRGYGREARVSTAPAGARGPALLSHRDSPQPLPTPSISTSPGLLVCIFPAGPARGGCGGSAGP